MISDEALLSLVELGFTHLEAQVYAFLVSESPATGYRVAQAIGKPAANTYKAIQSLERKGAVVAEEGENRVCRAIPAEELLERLHRQFQANRIKAAQALKETERPSADERVYVLRSREAVLERGRRLLSTAEEVVVFAASAQIGTLLKEEAENARQRGVEVLALMAEPLPSIDAYPLPESPYPEELRMVADGRESLIAYMDGESIYQALCSQSIPLSLALHSGIAAEISLANLEEKVRDEAGPKRLQRALAQHRSVTSTPAFRDLSASINTDTSPS